MTSLYGNDPIWDFNIAQDIQDLYRPDKGFTPEPNTLSGFVYNNPNYTIWKFLMEKGGLLEEYDNSQKNCTMFIVSDENIRGRYDLQFNENIFLNMNRLTARELVLYNTLPGKINYEALTATPIARLMTKIDNWIDNKLFLKLYNGKYILNNQTEIYRDEIRVCNGIIHPVSCLLVPDSLQGVILNK